MGRGVLSQPSMCVFFACLRACVFCVLCVFVFEYVCVFMYKCVHAACLFGMSPSCVFVCVHLMS